MKKPNRTVDQAKRFLKTPLGLFVGVALFAIVAFTLIMAWCVRRPYFGTTLVPTLIL